MIDTESPPGAWQRELEQRPRRCFDCAHYVLRQPRGRGDTGYEACSLDRPLMPCEMYEREPGADDGR